VERHGEPVAAVVPISVYEQWKNRRERFFQTIKESAERANLSEAEAETVVQETIQAIRSQSH
jgi:hypothetical protein